jgi:methylmalonyl-CoA/ethylmalonyl-CoA epimerase
MPGLSGAAIGQVSRSVTHLATAVQWYNQTLGLDHLFTFDRRAFFQCGGTRLMLTQMGEDPDAKSVLYFQVSDIDAQYQALRQRGVAFVNAPHMIHRHGNGMEEWMAFFKDLDGGILAIMSQRSAGQPQESVRVF